MGGCTDSSVGVGYSGVSRQRVIAKCLEFYADVLTSGRLRCCDAAMLRCKLCLLNWPMTCYIYSCPASFLCCGKERSHAYFETDGRLCSYRAFIYEGVPFSKPLENKVPTVSGVVNLDG